MATQGLLFFAAATGRPVAAASALSRRGGVLYEHGYDALARMLKLFLPSRCNS